MTYSEWALFAFIMLISIGLIIDLFLKPEWKLPLSEATKIISGAWAIAMLLITLALERNSLDLYQSIYLYTTITLVAVTAWYAFQTHKMTKQMQEQMYNAVRPEIDIELSDVIEGLLNEVPHNIGIGPAIDVITFAITEGNKHEQFHFHGSIAPNTHLSEQEVIEYAVKKIKFNERQTNNYKSSAVYRDIYSQYFQSTREIIVQKDPACPTLGPSIVQPIKKNEWHKIFAEAQAEGNKLAQ